MVANVQQGPEGTKITDVGYLAGVAAFLLALLPLPLLEYTVHGLPYITKCQSEEELPTRKSIILIIGLAFCILFFIFHVLIGLRARKNLRKLKDHHFKNLPSRNALTFLDTQILCFLSNINFLLQAIIHFLVLYGALSWEVTLFIENLVQFVVSNIMISFIFPLYIMMKTRRYLPKLWDDDSPLILQNNDFYAVRISRLERDQPENSLYVIPME